MAERGPLFRIFDWQRALLNSDLPKETKLVGWALSTFTNKHGTNAHPGEALLAETLGVTPRSIRGHLMRLRADGFIARTVRGSLAEHRRWADVYELAFPDATTGSGFPMVADDHRSPVSGDSWAAEDDHRKSDPRPPETERQDHRKLVSAQQPMASTNQSSKASDSSESASRASAQGADPLAYGDPWTEDHDRLRIVAAKFGTRLNRNEEAAVREMLHERRPLEDILQLLADLGRRPRKAALLMATDRHLGHVPCALFGDGQVIHERDRSSRRDRALQRGLIDARVVVPGVLRVDGARRRPGALARVGHVDHDGESGRVEDGVPADARRVGGAAASAGEGLDHEYEAGDEAGDDDEAEEGVALLGWRRQGWLRRELAGTGRGLRREVGVGDEARSRRLVHRSLSFVSGM